MKIAFYAPLKPPGHAVPSGDRAVARLLMDALTQAGHSVRLESDLRVYLPDASDHRGLERAEAAAVAERARIAASWQKGQRPDLWFCYHPYYKSPDLLGPELCRQFDLPWASAEASLSRRRSNGIWGTTQAMVRSSVRAAAVNFAMTARDQAGILENEPSARIMRLRPFLDINREQSTATRTGPMVTVAMMRDGDKMRSYTALAAALSLLPERIDWRLAVAGDGPQAEQVRKMFPSGRVDWLGQLTAEAVRQLLVRSSFFVWPGCAEAYGMAYLEAQAAGLPVVAWATAGVPEVVEHGTSGLLSKEGDLLSLARDVERLLTDDGLRNRMGRAAQLRVRDEHGIERAASVLSEGLKFARGAIH
ncbi:glycosyltransferase family 4 protein [Halodurantibacterium flavum]|uniref:Glycosyltransferase family 4 protein n=1 Tax=Halodurantibacterium flavum TaxID=1382802 RepID=A0ABW4RZQ4_9RHOB